MTGASGKPPAPVIGTAGGEPVSVEEEEEESPAGVRAASRAQKARERQYALQTKGQRDTSLIWETTQMRLALPAVWTALGVSAIGALGGHWMGLPPELQMACAFSLFSLSGMIVGFYFGRTNHLRVGGPGGDDAGTR